MTNSRKKKLTASEFFLFQCYIGVNPVNDDFTRHVTISSKYLKHQMSSCVPFALIDSHARDKNWAFAFVYEPVKVLLGQLG